MCDVRIEQMAPIRELRRLFEAIGRKDWDAAQSVAQNMAALEAKRGNRLAARALRDSLVHKNGNSTAHQTILEMGLSRRNTSVKLDQVRLSLPVRRELQSLLGEFKHSASLQSRGFDTRRKLLFTGPPGCGKSLTAQALANELCLPHFVVRFDSIIGSYLGQTATHLRQVFRFAETNQSVLLFDEIDALGKRRGNPADVGELDRIVIALMQELELGCPSGFIVATSNLPEHLDRALWRRFDAHIEFPAPRKPELRSFALSIAKKFGIPLPAFTLSLAMGQSNYAEAEKIVVGYMRHQIISELDNKNGRK
jgi:SpoVK/Ycf46/Vps4 family AAA+-type ATPase